MIVVSFDIDGTLETGDPPGIVPIALVKRAQHLGYVIGSCSDRPISHQEAMWAEAGIAPHFTALKHRLGDVRARFPAAVYYHVGDTETDEWYAMAAGFRFLKSDAEAHREWSVQLFAPRVP